jgi:hypothetical protein
MTLSRTDRIVLAFCAGLLVLFITAVVVARVTYKSSIEAIASKAGQALPVQGQPASAWTNLNNPDLVGRWATPDGKELYIISLRLFGGISYFGLNLNHGTHEKKFLELGSTPVTPYSTAITLVVRSKLLDSTRQWASMDLPIAGAADRIAARIMAQSVVQGGDLP